MNDTTIYNMYSSGENVLGNIPHDQGNTVPSASYVWGSQEKLKGRVFEWTDWLIGSAVCGWGFNLDIYGRPDRPGNLRDPADAILINPTNLITDPYFDDSYYDLFSTNTATAQAYASNNRKALLAQSIPARTFAVGRNSIGSTNIYKNVNMNTDHQDEDVWPASRVNSDDGYNWLHSDIKYIGYIYNYKAYNYIVNEGGLK